MFFNSIEAKNAQVNISILLSPILFSLLVFLLSLTAYFLMSPAKTKAEII